MKRTPDAKPGNSNLHDSSRNKQDEFYTDLRLVEDELKHYRPHFRGARVLCNCDDPYESSFFKYFFFPPALGGRFPGGYSTVTDFARLRGWSISQPRSRATW